MFVFKGSSTVSDTLKDYVRIEDEIRIVGQRATNVTITTALPGTYIVPHARGVFELFDASDSISIADITFI